MIKALYYCHKIIKVIHRDIKPDNIMINHNNEAVLIDFGVSAIVEDQEDDTVKNNMGSYVFFAPEMFQSKTNGVKIRGEKTDIWALGVTLYFMLSGVYPSGNPKDLIDLRDKITLRDIDFSIIKNKLAREVLETILEKDPEKRATTEEILKLNWVTNNQKEVIET